MEHDKAAVATDGRCMTARIALLFIGANTDKDSFACFPVVPEYIGNVISVAANQVGGVRFEGDETSISADIRR
jgi:hypothetical protein